MTDYELYQILESNGYETNNENLEILKEGLESGEYYIEEDLNLDESRRLDREAIKKVEEEENEKRKYAMRNGYMYPGAEKKDVCLSGIS